MEDLSHLLGDPVAALAPSNMHSGNRPSQPAPYTAPGTPSPSVDEGDVTPAPYASSVTHENTTLTDADGSRATARPMFRLGAWNDMGGGHGPR